MNEKKPNPPTDPRDGFTPGPWRERIGADFGKPWAMHIEGDGICVGTAYGRSHAECASNARLIASAPTLLADNERQAKVIEAMRGALDEARRELGNYKRDSLGGVNSSTVAAIESIDAALAMESQK